MATDGPDPKPCDKEIFENGTCIAVALGSSNAVERWVQASAKKANARVDWHYAAGRAMILHLGDDASQRRAIEALQTTERGTVQIAQIAE